MFEKILNAEIGRKPSKVELAEIKQAVLEEKPPNDYQEFFNEINNNIYCFIESEKAKVRNFDEEDAKQKIAEEVVNEHIKTREEKNSEIERLKKKYSDILERAITEVTNSGSDDAYKILLVLGRIRQEMNVVQ